MPYDASAPLEAQVHSSVASSLHNLRHSDDEQKSYIDCLLLHSPLQTMKATLEAWEVLESYVPHRIRKLGISNTSLSVLEALYNSASVKPSVVQNRFYAAEKYDVQLRRFCREKNIAYQSFWTLTANPKLLVSEPVVNLAGSSGVPSAVALYGLVMSLGITVLNGTTSAQHMREDLDGVKRVQAWAAENPSDWEVITRDFRRLIEGGKTR